MLLSLALSAFAVDATSAPLPPSTEAVAASESGGEAAKPKQGSGKKKKGSSSTGGGRSGSSSGSTGSTGSSGSSGSSASSDEESGDVQLFKKHKLGKTWKYQAYVMPGAGVKITTGDDADAADSGGDSSLGGSLGADAGFKYWHKKWHGNLGLGGAYTYASDYRGYEVTLGNTFGNRQKYWGLDAGLELFYNAYTFADATSNAPGTGATAASNADIEGAPGVSIPVIATLGPKKYYGVLGVKPSFPIGSDRGSAAENITYIAGFGANVGGVNGQLYYVHQVVGGVAFNSVEAAVPF